MNDSENEESKVEVLATPKSEKESVKLEKMDRYPDSFELSEDVATP